MSNYGKLRKHQKRAVEVAEEIAIGKRRGQKIVTAGITPGGGKTLMSAVFCDVLASADLIEQVIVVVPNNPLQRQMVEGFHSPKRSLHRFLRASSSQQPIPGTGVPFGQCVTYQKLTSEREAKKLAKWASKRKTLVIFDECHHLCESKAWERGAAHLVDASVLVLCMSGTLWRWDEERIPFIAYDANNRAVVDIRYSRADAIDEQAILPVEFKLIDGRAIYEHHNVPHNTRLSAAPMKEQARALATALKSADYAEDFIVAALGDWERYREQYYPSSAIVVCHTQKEARRAMGLIRAHFPRHAAALSLSDDGAVANKAIKKFRAGDVSILVTVRKAYEGLDVPNASHLVYLGNARSWPFLDQVIARVTRFNAGSALGWEDQRGHVYTPDDLRMREYIANMLNEQAETYREKARRDGSAMPRESSSFKPEGAEVVSIGNGADGRVLTEEENAGVHALEERFPWLTVRAPLLHKLEIALSMGLIPPEQPRPNAP